MYHFLKLLTTQFLSSFFYQKLGNVSGHLTYRTCIQSPPDALKTKDLDLTWCFKKPAYSNSTVTVTVSNTYAIFLSTKASNTLKYQIFFRMTFLSAKLTIAIIARSTEKTVKIIQSHAIVFGILFVTAATSICKFCL